MLETAIALAFLPMVLLVSLLTWPAYAVVSTIVAIVVGLYQLVT